ncbi:MAG: PSD1 and planctomycete cytochrome C domain-containing protein [Phycisphaeraceae bacterium]
MFRMPFLAGVVFVCATPLLAAPTAPANKLSPSEVEFFEKKVRPILVASCYECHAAEHEGKAVKIKGGLRLDTAAGVMAGGETGEAIVPGEFDKGLLIKAIRWTDKDLQMPPKTKLSDEQIRVLEQWVKMGAPDPRTAERAAAIKVGIDIEAGKAFWAFVAPKKQAMPNVKDRNWAKSDIDQIILASLEAKGLKPAWAADKLTLLRRATYDLTGLPPSEEEIRGFLNDTSADAFEKVVDRLLASNHFGERWGRHWLDIVRYAESTGMSRNYPYSYAWRYRDYVIDAFNKDKPFDQFIMEQLAGDLLEQESGVRGQESVNTKPTHSRGWVPSTRDERHIATGFLAMGPKDLNERNQLQYTMDNVDEQIDVVSRSLLALSVSCARCHDHKFDPIPTADYYAVAGIFRSTDILAGYNSKQGGGNKQSGDKLMSLTGDPTEDSQSADDAKAAEQTRKRIAKVEADLAKTEAQMKALQAEAKKPKKVAADKKADAADAKQELAKLRQDIARFQNELKALKKDAPDDAPVKGNFAMGVRDLAKPTDTPIYIKGEVDRPGKVVPRGVLQVLTTSTHAIPADASGRLELARWIASPDNPLTARVMANRIWQHLFGEGIVRTVDNFGLTGEKPNNLALLDHLSLRLVEKNWSIKGVVKEIMLSRAYQMSSSFNQANFNIDPENRLVWRQNQRRLEVEAIRDAMLSASGTLDLSPPQGSPVQKLAIGEINGKGSAFDSDKALAGKRSVYIPIVRSSLPGMFELFDFAEPSMVNGDRDVTTVATQALFMMNSSFVLEQSSATAARLMKEEAKDDAARVDRAYMRTLGRPASSTERERAVKFVESYDKDRAAGWTALCQALFACAEFRYLN